MPLEHRLTRSGWSTHAGLTRHIDPSTRRPSVRHWVVLTTAAVDAPGVPTAVDGVATSKHPRSSASRPPSI